MATTATIGFAHNHKGQALINSLNRSPNSTALGNWLETSFPYLDGVSSSHNLTSATNSTLAMLVKMFLGESGTENGRAHPGGRTGILCHEFDSGWWMVRIAVRIQYFI